MKNPSYICQSCGMPMEKNDDFGTNQDLSKNLEYCTFCYQKGSFTHPTQTMEGQIEMNTQIGVSHLGMEEKEARRLSEKIIPHLKRWQK